MLPRETSFAAGRKAKHLTERNGNGVGDMRVDDIKVGKT